MTILKTKTEVIREFVKRIPNAENASVDYCRDLVTVWFDNVHCKEYKASEIVDKFISLAKSKGLEVVWRHQ